jgi:hypothetical protein
VTGEGVRSGPGKRLRSAAAHKRQHNCNRKEGGRKKQAYTPTFTASASISFPLAVLNNRRAAFRS